MDTLVDYGSSDEDTDVSAPQASATTTRASNVSTVGAAAYTQPSKEPERENVDTANGPLQGPSMPMDGDQAQDGDIRLSEEPAMSEREAVRYLTRATHPMTSLPPSPPGSPDPSANAKFKRFLELKAKGVHFNEDLARKSTFQNPSLLFTMMVRAGIEGDEQYHTALPQSLWDPTDFPTSAYKEELLKSQTAMRTKEEASKKALSASGKRTIEIASGTASDGSSRSSTPGYQPSRKRP